jgi:pimeloyl-ACP methyl ester carboxylesterase
MSKNIYILSGLGVDERVFQRIDFFEFKPIFIKWILPLRHESIENYAARLLEQIKTSYPILLGLSFGGLIAVEIAKQIETEKVILISSAKTNKEIPFYYRLIGKIGINKLLPIFMLRQSHFFTNWFFGASSIYDKQLLKAILRDTDPIFLKWAINKIVNWQNQSQIKNLIHIHGISDRILPIYIANCNIKIKDGGHLMILNKSVELSKIIHQLIVT